MTLQHRSCENDIVRHATMAIGKSHVAIAERTHIALPVDTARFDKNIFGFATIGTTVHAQGTPDSSGNAAQKRQPRYAPFVEAEYEPIRTLFEETFHHDQFTGRSSTFFAYEGLGSVYWHMVSKLLLAAQEAAQAEAAAGHRETAMEIYYQAALQYVKVSSPVTTTLLAATCDADRTFVGVGTNATVLTGKFVSGAMSSIFFWSMAQVKSEA